MGGENREVARPASPGARAAVLRAAPRFAAIAALALALFLTCGSLAQAITYYSSQVAGPDPTRLENWWTYPDSTGSHPPDFASGDMFVVQGGHVMSTTDSWVISGEGCALWLLPAAMLTVGDGGANRLGLIGATFQIDGGATYVHNSTAPWDSTCFAPGVTRNFEATGTVVLRATHPRPSTDITWGSLTVDLATSPGADWNWEGHLTRVNGDLTVSSTGGHAMWLADSTSPMISVQGDVVLDGGELLLGGGGGTTTLTVTGNLAVNGGTLGSSGSAVHRIAFSSGLVPRTFTWSGGTLAVDSIDWQVDTETLVLASDFTLPPPRSFTIASTGTLALAAALANPGALLVNGTLRLEAGGSLGAEAFYGGAGRLEYAGGSVTTGPEWGTSLAGTPLNVTIAAGETSTVTLAGNRSVDHALTFASGRLATGPDTLSLGPLCAVTGAGAGRYVHGNLARAVPATLAGPLSFDVGDSTGYAPVVVAFDTVSAAGTLVAGTTVPGAAPAPDEPPVGSGISQSRYVDRAWTLAGGGAGPPGFGSATATLHFVPGDVRGGGVPDSFIVARDSSGTWSHPEVSERQSASITAAGLTGFGAFRVGEPASDTYTLVVTTVGSGTVTRDPDQLRYAPGSTVQLTAVPEAGWRFAGWSGDTTGSDNPITLTMDGDKTVTAHFVVDQYVLTVLAEPDSGGTVSGSGTYAPGTVVPVTATPAPGWRFAGWSGEVAEPDSAATTVLVDSARTVTAHFVVDQYTLTVLAEPDSGGTVSGSGMYASGTVVPVTATPAPGWRFTGWTGEVAEPDSAATTVLVDSARTVTAHFVVQTFTLTVATVGSGTVAREPLLERYAWGTTVQLSAWAAANWRFTGWSGDTTTVANPLVVTMYGDLGVTATFEHGTVCVSQVYGGGGGNDAPYTHDFIELHNRGPGPIDITGWTVQYAGAGSATWAATPLIGTIPAGGYYLVQEASGPGGLAPLPTPDAAGSIRMNARAGKVVLVNGAGLLSATCPHVPSILDLVGYGATDCWETSPTGAPDNLNAVLRNGEGCDDTDNNLFDFTVSAPAPRNSGSPLHPCGDWVGVDPAPVAALELAPVAPNPTRGGARVAFALPAAARTRLRVVDLQGRVVATLVDGVVPAGRHEARWDGAAAGGAARPGLYFVRLDAGGKQAVRSIVLVR